MGKGINAYGIFEEKSPLQYSRQDEKELQEKLELRKKRRKPNFGFLFTQPRGKLAWEW